MARPNTNTNEGKWQEVTQGVLVRKSENSKYFSLNWYGAIIHGCTIRQGNDGDFISWPSFQNKEGKYVKRAYVWADKGSDDENTLKRVLNAVK